MRAFEPNEARNSAVSATSSTVANFAVHCFFQHDILDDVLFRDAQFLGLLRYLLVDQRGADEAGADYIGADTCAAPSLATTFAKPIRPCLAVTYGALSTDASFECTDPM